MRKGFVLHVCALFISVASTFGVLAESTPTLWTVSYDSQPYFSPKSQPSGRIYRVHVNPDVLSSDEILLPIGFSEKKGVKRFSGTNGNITTWYGYVGGSQFLSTVSTDGVNVSAFIWTKEGFSERSYSLTSSRAGHFLSEGREGNRPIESAFCNVATHVDDFVSASKGGRHRAVGVADPVCGRLSYTLHTIDLLFVYEESAYGPEDAPPTSQFTDEQVRLRFHEWTASLNATLLNSQIYNGTFRVVGIEKRDRVNTGDAWQEHVWAEQSSWIHSLRDERAADLVINVIGYSRSGVNGYGGTWLDTVGWSSGWNHTFLHEVGHSLGGGHQPEDSNYRAAEDSPFAYAHSVVPHFSTAVGIVQEGVCWPICPRMPVYSNPNVMFQGMPMGVPDERDNARMARIMIPIVAAYRDGTAGQCMGNETKFNNVKGKNLN